MKSILNSISSGDLQVQEVPRDLPVKEDSIIDLLQDPEIEFNYSPKCDPPVNSLNVEVDIDLQIVTNQVVEEPKKDFSVEELFENSEIQFDTCPIVEDKLQGVNTGFSENHDLHYECPCHHPEVKTPLYREAYLSEFKSEAEKAAARHSLGIYNKDDVVAMSLLTAEDQVPTQSELKEVTLKQIRKGDRFFAPYTLTQAVFDYQGNSLEVRLQSLYESIDDQKQQISNLLQISNEKNISTLGDVKVFLQGFNNGDDLKTIINDLDKEMLRFEYTGTII